MKEKSDLVRAWIQRAERHLSDVGIYLTKGESLVACYKALLAGEKYLKAYLTAADANFYASDGLDRLIQMALERDPRFTVLKAASQELVRYDIGSRIYTGREPSARMVLGALQAATKFKQFVLDLLRADLRVED